MNNKIISARLPPSSPELDLPDPLPHAGLVCCWSFHYSGGEGEVDECSTSHRTTIDNCDSLKGGNPL